MFSYFIFRIRVPIAFAQNPLGAGPYLKPLLDYAKSNVPASQQSTTPIFVRGTDNLRTIPGGASEAILLSIFGYIVKNYGFFIPSNCVDLLSGNQEGGFLWVSANYLLGTFADGKKPIGTLDMGSGSTQIAFIPKSGTVFPPGYTYKFVYKKDTYAPYVYSYSGYGYLAALYTPNTTLIRASSSNLVYNPCLLYGYSESSVVDDRTITLQGTGSWSQCGNLLLAFLNLSAPCANTPCAFSGAWQPSLNGDFMAVSNFRDVADILDIGDKGTVQEIIDRGIKFCSLSWSDVQKKYPDEDVSDLKTFCFGANYISTLLSQGFGFSLNTKVEFGKKYNGAPYSSLMVWILS